MLLLGLSEDELKLINGVFKRHPSVTEVKLFGSRAKGVHGERSDVDLALFGVLDDLKAQSIEGELEGLPLPYQFDVKRFDSIQLEALREHIERVGIVLYTTTRQ
jgi:predicted nucleotidyltransferase